MATTVNISPQDVANAANFLEAFLSDSNPNGDFSSGTALRDLTVGALAAVFAFVRADATQVRQMQSLQTVAAATGGDPEALRDAVVAILSNFFVTPKAGAKARGSALGHASQLTDIFIQPTHQFTRSPGVVFVVDSPSTYFIPQNQLIPIVDSTGAVLEYQFRIPLVAVATGDAYNIDPGLFSDFDRFNPFVTRIENPDKFSGGKGPETVDQILARAPTAISVRNLINTRSITATLDDNFPDTRSLFIAGFGDPEMQRDRLDVAKPFLALHVGGMVDIYLLLDLVETSFTGAVGGLFARPDGVINMFRDPSSSFANVEVGDVIRIIGGVPQVPGEFVVVENHGNELVVDPRVPFGIATDESAPPANVSYTIGRIGPIFNDVLSGTGGVPLATGVTSRHVSHPGGITLPGGPVMDILDVAILDPTSPESAFKSPVDGFEHFPNHVNGTPREAATAIQGLQFATVIHNPLEAQSARQWMEIVIGTDARPSRFDGRSLRVRYRTLAGYDAIYGFVTDRLQRTVAANQLPRGHNPVSLSIALTYKLSPTAPSLLDDSVIAQTVVDFINAFDTSVTPIDVSAIGQQVRNAFPTISALLPFEVTYTLLAPTGAVLTYRSGDIVVIDPSKQVDGPALDLGSLGVTDRTVRYLANTLDVTAHEAS
jgi:hypothetical protein